MRPVQLGDRAAGARARQLADDQGKEVKFFCVGRKGYEQLRRNFERQIIEHVELRSVRQLGFVNAEDIAKKVIARFKAGEFDVCTLFYSRFKSVIAQIPTAQQIIPLVVEAKPAGQRRPGDRIRIRARGGRNSRPAVAAQPRGADFPRAAGKQRLVLRRADERDGQRDAQRRRHDPEADADLQPHPSGDDHQGADRDHLRRRSDVTRGARPWPTAHKRRQRAAATAARFSKTAAWLWPWVCRRKSAALAKAIIPSSLFALGWSACFGQAILALAKKHGLDGQAARSHLRRHASTRTTISFALQGRIEGLDSRRRQGQGQGAARRRPQDLPLFAGDAAATCPSR